MIKSYNMKDYLPNLYIYLNNYIYSINNEINEFNFNNYKTLNHQMFWYIYQKQSIKIKLINFIQSLNTCLYLIDPYILNIINNINNNTKSLLNMSINKTLCLIDTYKNNILRLTEYKYDLIKKINKLKISKSKVCNQDNNIIQLNDDLTQKSIKVNQHKIKVEYVNEKYNIQKQIDEYSINVEKLYKLFNSINDVYGILKYYNTNSNQTNL